MGNVVKPLWISGQRTQPNKVLLGFDQTPPQPQMTLVEGVKHMLDNRPTPVDRNTIVQPGKVYATHKSVLNMSLTAQQAWDIVWTRLNEMRNDPQCEFREAALLPDWLIKRIRQVTSNKMNPDLETVADTILDPVAEKPADPFEREFS